jgi:hypothetical protein
VQLGVGSWELRVGLIGRLCKCTLPARVLTGGTVRNWRALDLDLDLYFPSTEPSVVDAGADEVVDFRMAAEPGRNGSHNDGSLAS